MSARQVDAGEFARRLGPDQRGEVDATLMAGKGIALYNDFSC